MADVLQIMMVRSIRLLPVRGLKQRELSDCVNDFARALAAA